VAEVHGPSPKPSPNPKGASNVFLILTDDTGLGASSIFGGPVLTPALDRVAARGPRYNNVRATALCQPRRAVLLVGRNHHSVGFGNIYGISWIRPDPSQERQHHR